MCMQVPRLKQHISDRYYHTCGSDGGLGLHAHMDAGMMISTGERPPLRLHANELRPSD